MPYRIAAIRALADDADQSQAVIGTDGSGTVVYWNSVAERLYGWPAADAIGRDILDLTPTLMSKREGSEILRTLLDGRPWSGPFMVRDRAGQPMIVQVEDRPVMHEGAVVGVVGISRPASVA